MHDLVRDHILPTEVTPRRSVILNSWEAFFFDINEDLMSDFARGAKDCGMDTVVMDDGWFGARVGDRAGLGDWHANPERFKNGLPSFIRSIKSLGIRFGIWIEPEMVNRDSDLYRAHPDWVLAYPDRMRTDARHQYILDFANPEVVENIKAQLAETFDPEPPDYFKWDMNRNMTDAYSHALPPERQDEVPHRYMLGVYDLYSWLREHFPNAMLENCSGGGGRYDLGMMSFSHQIWASDNTNPEDRINIQYASTLGYPAATMSCHVANHSDSALNPRKLEFGYHVALGGALGYEFNVLHMPEEVRKSLREQIKEYRVYEPLILRGDLYRLLVPSSGAYAYYFAAKDGSEMLLSYIQAKGDSKQTAHRLRIAAADKNASYVCTQDGKTYTGEELRHGITVTACTEDEYSRIWHFVRKVIPRSVCPRQVNKIKSAAADEITRLRQYCFLFFDFPMFRLIAFQCAPYPLRAVKLRRVHVSPAAISSTLPLIAYLRIAQPVYLGFRFAICVINQLSAEPADRVYLYRKCGCRTAVVTVDIQCICLVGRARPSKEFLIRIFKVNKRMNKEAHNRRDRRACSDNGKLFAVATHPLSALPLHLAMSRNRNAKQPDKLDLQHRKQKQHGFQKYFKRVVRCIARNEPQQRKQQPYRKLADNIARHVDQCKHPCAYI